ncbi:Hypothetical protein R9X50_00276100 [Acrodontium crateriforme]|uniref:Uncharacterized protein n=1 Tax=Acrodontium crateriforme TaxID=150365 RepID=A0AAQ3R6X7_9PEZI|nr:Hypothetical protein R9X50_00276100 [Acrodontium crateriforme]
MAMRAHITVGGLVCLTVLASIAEIVLASLVLHRLNKRKDEYNYSYNGIEVSSADTIIPLPVDEQDIQFSQPWVLVHSGLVSAVPRVELAAGAIAFVLGLVTFAYIIEKAWVLRRSGKKYVVSGLNASDRIAAILLPILVLVITGLFIYVFAASGYSASYSQVTINGPLGPEAYDATPTWEVWTCEMSSFLKTHQDFPAARSEWRTTCQITTGARWNLLPVFVLALATASTTLLFQFRSAFKA